MPLYRCLLPISRGEKRYEIGVVDRFDWLDADTQAILLDRGAIGRVAAPPLAAIPSWNGRADRLARLGILTVEDFADAKPVAVCRALRIGMPAYRTLLADTLALLSAPRD